LLRASSATSFQSTLPSAHRLTHFPRPYGVSKKRLSASSRSASSGATRKAIDSLPPTISNATKPLVPARKVGWFHVVFSSASGSARQSLRRRSISIEVRRPRARTSPAHDGDQDHAEDESADVREVRGATGLLLARVLRAHRRIRPR